MTRSLPIAADRFEIRLAVGRSAHEKLKKAQELLSHSIPSGDLAEVFERVLDLAIGHLEKQKFASTDRPQRRGRPSHNARHVPARVRRAVRARDGEQCTFVADGGHRCGERRFLEFDHVLPVAQGGASTVENLRLRCRTHNQMEADRTYGRAFMEGKREQARAAKAEAHARTREAKASAEADATARAEAEAAAASEARARALEEARVAMEAREQKLDVIAGLKWVGFSVERARWASEAAAAPGLTLEQHIKEALKLLKPRRAVTVPAPAPATAGATPTPAPASPACPIDATASPSVTPGRSAPTSAEAA